jgi:hypothetical protein
VLQAEGCFNETFSKDSVFSWTAFREKALRRTLDQGGITEQ